MNIDQRKAEIRAATLLRRDALPAAARFEYSRVIISRILAMQEFEQARSVAAYYSFGSEIDTLPLLRAVLESSKTLLMPRINRRDDRLDVFEVTNLDADLRPGIWGIPEPDPAVCTQRGLEESEIVLVPGVAFDRHGERIGYGKGYYDKLIAACRTAGGRPRTVAGAFEVQIVDSIPTDDRDMPIGKLVTEAGAWVGRGM